MKLSSVRTSGSSELVNRLIGFVEGLLSHDDGEIASEDLLAVLHINGCLHVHYINQSAYQSLGHMFDKAWTHHGFAKGAVRHFVSMEQRRS